MSAPTHSILVDVVRSKLDLIAGMDGLIAKQKFEDLVEQLEAAQRHHEKAVVKIHLVEGRANELRYALRDAMAFIQPEVAGDYRLWESLVGESNPASRQGALDEETMDDLRRAAEESDDDAVDYDELRRQRKSAPVLRNEPEPMDRADGAIPQGETGAA